MAEDLMTRIERVLCAEESSNLTPGGWALDHVMAMGMASQRNRLGGALVHLMTHANEANLRLIVFLLAGEMERGNVCKARDSAGFAQDALRWWLDHHCPTCGGRGVINFEQDTCPACWGSQERPKPSGGPVADGIGIILHAVNQIESVLRHRLGNAPDRVPDVEYRLAMEGDSAEDCPQRGMRTPGKKACA